MAAQPKNKITRVEQGKRRKGNTPKLLKDIHMSKVPLYKVGFFQKVMAMAGSTSTKIAKSSAETRKEKAAAKALAASATSATAAGTNPMAQAPRPSMAQTSGTVKKTTRTQHKGG